MRQFLACALLAVAAFITGCGGGGSSAPAPPGVQVVAGDESATVFWVADPSVQYWVWVAQGTGTTTQNCPTSIGCRIFVNVAQPFIVPGLTNGTTYSVTVNGRHDGGPGGDGTAPIAFVPRFAGSSWSAGTSLGPNDLHGIAFTLTTTGINPSLVTVGANGTIFSSTSAITWTAAVSGTTANLNAVQYRNGVFIALGDGGTILTSSDSVTWTPQTSPTTNALYALEGNGSGQVVAVGAQGTILTSTNSIDWTKVTSNTTADLHAIAFGNGRYVAVGSGGVQVSSTDASSWKVETQVTTADLKGVAYGSRAATSTVPALATFVTVGTAGTILTSADGLTWKAQASATPNNLAGVVFGTRFIAVGSGGAIVVSDDGATWQPAQSGTTADLNSVTFTVLTGSSIGVGYAAVGATGTNLTSF